MTKKIVKAADLTARYIGTNVYFADPENGGHVEAELRDIYHRSFTTYVNVLNPHWPGVYDQLLEFELLHTADVTVRKGK